MKFSLNILRSALLKQPSIWVLAIALMVAMAVSTHRIQNITPAPCDGLADCVKYGKMAQAFRTNNYEPIEAPFNLRIVAPFLSSKLGDTPQNGFITLNLISIFVITLFSFGIIKKLNLGTFEYLVLIGWFLLHPLGFKLYNVYPMMVDLLSYALFSILIFLFLSKRYFLLGPTLLISLFTKESFTFVVLTVFLADLLASIEDRKNIFKKMQIPAVTCGLTLVAYALLKKYTDSSLFPPSGPTASAAGTIIYFAKEAARDPNRVLVWLGSILASTGLFALLVANKQFIKTIIKNARTGSFLVLGSLGFLLFGLLAGSDMSRIIFNGNLLIITTSLFFARQNSQGAWRLIIVSVISFSIALSYDMFFPATFEYAYYTLKTINTTIYFILISGFVGICGITFAKSQFKVADTTVSTSKLN